MFEIEIFRQICRVNIFYIRVGDVKTRRILSVKAGDYSTSVESKNGTYTVGMTCAQAQKNDSYKAKVGIDFRDLDKDENGVLSQEEILQGRVESAWRNRNQLYAIGLGIATGSIALGVVESVATAGLGSAFGLSIAATGTAVGSLDIATGREEYKKAEQELQNYYNDPAAQLVDSKRKLNCKF